MIARTQALLSLAISSALAMAIAAPARAEDRYTRCATFKGSTKCTEHYYGIDPSTTIYICVDKPGTVTMSSRNAPDAPWTTSDAFRNMKLEEWGKYPGEESLVKCYPGTSGRYSTNISVGAYGPDDTYEALRLTFGGSAKRKPWVWTFKFKPAG